MNKEKKAFAELKKFDLSDWELTLYLVKHRIEKSDATYSVLHVNADEKLKRRLLSIVKGKVDQKNYRIEPYEFASADQDEKLYAIDTKETDFSKIQIEIMKGTKVPLAKEFSDLLNSWAYVVHLQHEGKELYALRKVSALSKATKVNGLTSMFFQNSMLVDLDDQQIFSIDNKIDLFVYSDVTFITSKKDFESALNFRKGMETSRDAVIADFAASKFFTDVMPFKEVIGSNMRLLRKVAMVRNSGYYKNQAYMKKLITSNKVEKWGLIIDDKGCIQVTAENVELILTLLNNSRLKSLINAEVFDVAVKTKVV